MFVRRVLEREEQAHGTRIGGLLTDPPDRLVDRGIVERAHDFASRCDALFHLEAPLTRNQGWGEVGKEIEHVGPGLAADLEQIAKARSGEERDLAAAALDERVGSHGSAMGKTRELVRGNSVARRELRESLNDCARRIVRRGRAFENVDPAAIAVMGIEVGEGSAYVYADMPRGSDVTHDWLFST